MKTTMFVLVSILSINSFAFIKVNSLTQKSPVENKVAQVSCEKACDCSKMKDHKIELRIK